MLQIDALIVEGLLDAARVSRRPFAHAAQVALILKVPQFQFIDRLWIFQLCHRDGRAQCSLCVEIPQVQSSGLVDDVLVNMRRQVQWCALRAEEPGSAVFGLRGDRRQPPQPGRKSARDARRSTWTEGASFGDAAGTSVWGCRAAAE